MSASLLKQEKNCSAWLCFYIHFITEVACFFVLSRLTQNTADRMFLWFLPLFYDMFAFVPQALIGKLSDRFSRFPVGIIGTALLFLALALFGSETGSPVCFLMILLCLGNCCIHVFGAEVTLRCSGGRLSPCGIFIAGGSFGVISGKLLAMLTGSFWYVAVLVLTMLPFILLADEKRRRADSSALKACCEIDGCVPERSHDPCGGFDHASDRIPETAVILISVFVVIVRGYVGYGIPTSWNKTMFQTILLFCSMGAGKALGGVLADRFGARRTGIFSLAAALPCLLAGNEHMTISLIGVLLFSMTMPVSLGILVSTLRSAPGLAFGLTTIGLFLGTAPVFFWKFASFQANCVTVAVLTLLCIFGMALTARRKA